MTFSAKIIAFIGFRKYLLDTPDRPLPITLDWSAASSGSYTTATLTFHAPHREVPAYHVSPRDLDIAFEILPSVSRRPRMTAPDLEMLQRFDIGAPNTSNSHPTVFFCSSSTWCRSRPASASTHLQLEPSATTPLDRGDQCVQTLHVWWRLLPSCVKNLRMRPQLKEAHGYRLGPT